MKFTLFSKLWRRLFSKVNPRRSAGAKKGWETRRQREQSLPLPMDNNPLIPPKP